MTLYRIARPALFRLDPEATHDRVLAGLRWVSARPALLRALERVFGYEDPRLAVTLFGQTLPNPLAVAAGLDKNGVAVDAFAALGFAYTEVGTVTPRAQPGNPKPRVFRLPTDRALINRMGFPGEGMESVAGNLTACSGRFALNVGPNRDRVEHAAAEAITVIRRLLPLRPLYVAVNLSSPNTAGLRDLQAAEPFRSVLSEIQAELRRLPLAPPLLVKLSPDLPPSELDEAIGVVTELHVDGVIAANTTVTRPENLRSRARGEAGGLSGLPLRDRATEIVARIWAGTEGRVPIIAAGGIFSGADALDKIGAGATAVQLYTGLIYEGPGIAKRLKHEMARILEREVIEELSAIRGSGFRSPR